LRKKERGCFSPEKGLASYKVRVRQAWESEAGPRLTAREALIFAGVC
jgi:hypothetical protein